MKKKGIVKGAGTYAKTRTQNALKPKSKKRTARVIGVKKGKRPDYKVPKTPKSSGYKWGG